MIPSPALQLSSPVAMPGAVLPGEAGQALEGADFAALLAQSALPVTLPEAPQPGPAVADATLTNFAPMATEPASEPAEPAIAAARPGKILPVNLPVNLPLTAQAAPGQDEAPPGKAEPDRPHDLRPVAQPLPLTAQAGKSRAAVLRAQAGDKAPIKDAEPEAAPPAATLEPALALAIAPPPALPDMVQLPLQTLPPAAQQAVPAHPAPAAQTAAAAEPVLARSAPLAAAVAPVIRALTDQIQPQQGIAPPAAAPQIPAGQITAPLAAPAPPPLTQVRLDVPLPEPLRPARFAAARAAPVLAAALGDERDTAASAVLAPGPVAAPPVTVSAAAPAPLERPHDFSALIDRLAAAREAAAPQSVSISLPHADFGRVQLHFRSEDGALAVSLASADPDFARIAAQAAPPVLAASEARGADHAPGQGSARSDGQAASASGHGNQRGQTDERRDERRGERQGRFEQLPRSASPDKGRGRSGIFA